MLLHHVLGIGTGQQRPLRRTVLLIACNYESTTSPVARNIERGYKESYIGFPGKGFHNPGHWESLYQVSWSVTVTGVF